MTSRRADYRRDDLRNQPRPPWSEHPEQRDGQPHRHGRYPAAEGESQAVAGKPGRSALDGEDIDEGAGKQDRHGRTVRAMAAMRREDPAHGDRRGEEEVEIGPGVEGAGDRLHRLRQHQRPVRQRLTVTLNSVALSMTRSGVAKLPTMM